MKNISTLIIAFLSFSFLAAAQDPTPRLNKSNRNNMITVNTGTVLQNYFYPVYTNNNNEYLVVYHRLFKKSNGIRLGLNINNRNDNTTKITPIPNTAKSSLVKVGLGYERFFYLAKSWNCFVGADFQYTESRT
jgi:hypothetical protein